MIDPDANQRKHVTPVSQSAEAHPTEKLDPLSTSPDVWHFVFQASEQESRLLCWVLHYDLTNSSVSTYASVALTGYVGL